MRASTSCRLLPAPIVALTSEIAVPGQPNNAMELFAPVRAATLDLERDGARKTPALVLSWTPAPAKHSSGCTLRSAHTWTCKGLNPQAEQMGRATPGFKGVAS